MWTVWPYRWWMKKGFCSCRSDLFPSALMVKELSEVTIASRHFFCSDISVKHSSLHSQKPLWFLSRYVSLSTTLSSNLISTWNRANRWLFLLSELFFYIFLGCLLVVLCSCAILSKTSWFHAANKNEQRTPTSIFRDGTTLKSDMQKYPKGKFEKNNVKTLNKLEKAQKKL